MPGISLAKLRENKRTVRIRFGEDSLMVDIYPDRFTNDLVDRYSAAASEEPRDYDEMAAAFNVVVDSWNLMADEGDEEPLPINGEVFRDQISLRVLNHIWAELNEAVTPKSRKKNERL